jgi:hypothetical protein
MRQTGAICAAVAAMSAAWVAWGHPVPSPVPLRWQMEFAPGPLRVYVDPAEVCVYWYFVYKVTNRTGRDQVWAPSLVLFTDAGEILPAGRGVPSRVTEDIARLLGNELLESPNQIIGEIRHGRENAKEGLAVWPARAVDVNELSLFIAGISGETVSVVSPTTGRTELLRKTLQRDYLIPGDMLARGSEPAPLVRETWVMR